MIKVKRALLSVSDKKGVVEFARGLHRMGVELLSTGGTARLLQKAGLPVKEVSSYTGFPEMLDGRVKTLHPAIHGGLLALRNNPEHMKALKQHNIGLIDMVVVNLYPFEKVIQKKIFSFEEAIENIDIGGPAMLRSAAKNYTSVAVVCKISRYKEILQELEINSGILSDSVLRSLALDAFSLTSRYDTAIAQFLQSRFKSGDLSPLPAQLTMRFSKIQDLRYGENPHQMAAFYKDENTEEGLPLLKQLHGKELSFNNILDIHAALEIVASFSQPTATVIKHNNPTGVAENKDLALAYKQAWKTDSLSAFGGIIGLNRKVDKRTAEAIFNSGFMECVVAPRFEKGALKILTRKKNLRLIELDPRRLQNEAFDYKKVNGGLLLQQKDLKEPDSSSWRVVTKVKPTKSQMAAAIFGWKVIKHVRSNAIILIKKTQTVGVGCGQTSRVDSARIAIGKAGQRARGSILISDAFLPHPDTVEVAAKAGIRLIVQTGGSIADPKVIQAAEKAKMAMVMTGVRHFKH